MVKCGRGAMKGIADRVTLEQSLKRAQLLHSDRLKMPSPINTSSYAMSSTSTSDRILTIRFHGTARTVSGTSENNPDFNDRKMIERLKSGPCGEYSDL